MKKSLIIALFALVAFTNQSFAQAPVVPKQEYMVISVIESLVAGGLGRSRMLITDENGKSNEVQMSNFFSMGGINFSNIEENDVKVTLKLKELSNAGWELATTTAGATESIFITRYLLRREKR
ncbi:MAG: hypothetical protein MUD08_09020 [Cytophagales bacterium]|nr:hypothetical protein [Cytophagales bacterium]